MFAPANNVLQAENTNLLTRMTLVVAYVENVHNLQTEKNFYDVWDKVVTQIDIHLKQTQRDNTLLQDYVVELPYSAGPCFSASSLLICAVPLRLLWRWYWLAFQFCASLVPTDQTGKARPNRKLGKRWEKYSGYAQTPVMFFQAQSILIFEGESAMSVTH